jgi:DNA-binding CsgD family transcriptional regulator
MVRTPMQQKSLMNTLSPKQFRIAILVAQGLTNQEIGKVVGNNPEVIRDYLRCLFDEVGCWSRLELAIRFAYELYEGRYNTYDYINHLHSLSKIVEDLGINTALTEPAESS